MKNLEDAIRLKNVLDTFRPLDKEVENRIMQKFRLDWNYHSNHIEGNTLTYGETKALILFGITAQGKPLKDHFEITGHNEAILTLEEVVKGSYPISENFIRELHVLLLKESYFRNAITTDHKPTRKKIDVGKYKTLPNHVLTKTGDTFYFASPEETPSMMFDLLEWLKKSKSENVLNPILIAGEFHYKFIRIHPFDDGNGRLARLLMNLILMQFGFPPIIIRTTDKENYFSALQQADAGIFEPFIEYLAQNLIRSLELMIKAASGGSIDEPDDIDKEIALLNQKILSSGQKSNKSKSSQAILELKENVITPFFELVLKDYDIFNNHYLDIWPKELQFVFPENELYLKYSEIDELKLKETIRIEFSIDFNKYKFIDLELDYASMYQFELHELYYQVFLWNTNKNKDLRNCYDLFGRIPYGQYIAKKEMLDEIKIDIKRHLLYIESKRFPKV
jgi:Fic family protein